MQPKIKQKNRSIRIAIRLTEEENTYLKRLVRQSHHRKKSSFIRAKIFSKKMNEHHQKRIEAYRAAGNLSDALNRIGTNFNQLVHGINTFKAVQLSPREVATIRNLGERLGQVLAILEKEKFD